jgi:anthranilate 1,2-dioxygenase (deaminating, decarboxylating) small subunit
MQTLRVDAMGSAVSLIYKEAYLLDRRMWSDWLNLFTEDLVYSVPSWRSDDETTTDPERELSLIYYGSRASLEDRVWRVKCGLSRASHPLVRTCHMVSNILTTEQDGDHTVHAHWTCHHFHPSNGEQNVLFGQSEYALREVAGDWKIARKRTIIANDILPAVVDFYHI